MDEFLLLKRIYEECLKNEGNITWDESTENGELKCRVDKENQLMYEDEDGGYSALSDEEYDILFKDLLVK